MDITKFNEKFNRVEGNIYTVEEVVTPLNGVCEHELIHDNATHNTINVYTGPKLTGNKINTYSISTPSLTPWKTVITIYSNEPKLYISYETIGDQVEAEDINNLQDAVNDTQKALNNEITRATDIENNLNKEVARATNIESTIESNLNNEIERAKAKENNLENDLNTNRVNWNDAYNKKHEHSNKSVIDTITSALISNWNSAFTHISDTLKHITSAERTLWNTVSNKAEKEHIHDDRYYTESEIDAKLKNYTTDDKLKEIEKQVLENNYASIETDNVLTKLESVKDGFVDNMVIGGKTIQSVKSRQMSKNTLSMEWDIFEDNTDLIKTSTKYTLIVNVTQLNSNVKIYFNTNILTRRGKFENGELVITTNGLYKHLLTSSDSFDDSTIQVTLRNSIRTLNTSGQGTPIKFEYMLLEGDWTDKQVPPYFEGIKSVGESEFSDGKYPIKVKSGNKNMLIYEPITNYTGAGITYNLDNEGNVICNGRASATSTFRYNFRGNSGELFYLLKGTYKLSIDSNSFPIGVLEYVIMQHETFSILGRLKSGTSTTITITEDKANLFCYVAISSGTTITDLKIPRPMLSISVDTTFKIPTIDSTIVKLEEPLRGLPNGVKDTIDFEKGVITRNIGKVVLNGSENISFISANSNDTTLQFNIMLSSSVIFNSTYGRILSDKFIIGQAGLRSTNYECIMNNNDGKIIVIRILKSKLASQDLAGFKKWLQDNPTTVYYQLATPTTEKLEIKDTLQTFRDGYIELENSITPLVNLDFSVSIPTILARHTELIDSLIDETKKPMTWNQLEGI